MIRVLIDKTLGALDPRMREVAGKAALSFALRLTGAAAQFGFTVLVARLFGPAGLGAYALALSVAVIASTLARWGLDQAALKYVAIHAARGEKAAAGRLVRQAGVLVGGGSLAVTVLLWLAAPVLCREIFHDPELSWLMRLMALSIVPFSLLNLLAEALRGLQRIGAYTLVQGVLVPVFSIVLLVMLQYTAGAELTGAAQVYVASCLLAAAGSLCLWRFYLGREGSETQVKPTNSRTLLNTANPMAWVALISVAMSFTETLLLGIFRTSGEVGLYAAALRLALLLNFVIIAFNSILAPKFASFYHAGDLESVHFMARRSIKLMLVATSPVFVLYFLVPGQVMQLFGAEFADASLVLTILTVGQLVNIATGPVGIMLMMTGHERVMRKNLLITSAFTLFFGAFVIWRFGMIGAAGSAATGMLLLNGLSVWAVRRRLGVPATISWVDEK